MQTLRVGRGYTRSWTVRLRDHRRIDVADTYTGLEPLELVICDDDGAALALAGSAVSWKDPSAPTVTLTVDDSDTADLGPAPRGLSIVLTDGGEPIEVYRAVLRVEPRASLA